MADYLIIALFVFTFLGIGFASVAMIAAEERRQRPARAHRVGDVQPLAHRTHAGSDDDRLAA